MASTAAIPGLPTVVTDYFDALNAEDFEALEGVWTEDAEVRAVGSRARVGLEEVMAYFRPLFGPWTEHRDQPTRVIGEGDAVVVEVRFSGRTEAGKELAFDAVDVFDLRDGRIAALTTWYDLVWLRGQL